MDLFIFIQLAFYKHVPLTTAEHLLEQPEMPSSNLKESTTYINIRTQNTSHEPMMIFFSLHCSIYMFIINCKRYFIQQINTKKIIKCDDWSHCVCFDPLAVTIRANRLGSKRRVVEMARLRRNIMIYSQFATDLFN